MKAPKHIRSVNHLLRIPKTRNPRVSAILYRQVIAAVADSIFKRKP